MPRNPRFFDPARIYHLTGHGIDDARLFRDEGDFQDFVLRIGRELGRHAWECYGVCLMGTHHHLLVCAPNSGIPEGMQVLHGRYSHAFNARHGRRGALFESRYRDRTIVDDAHLQHAIRYLARNPGESRATDYPWSTYGQAIGLHKPWPFFDPSRVVELFGSVAALRQFVEGV